MTSLITPECILDHPNLFKAKLPRNAKPGDKPKYNAVLLFTHEAMKAPEFAALQQAVLERAREEWGAKAEEFIRTGARKTPFRKDVEARGYDPKEIGGFINTNATEDYPPQVVGRAADGQLAVITDTREIYRGVRARVSLSCYAYDFNGVKGISFGLRNVLKVGDGPRLGGIPGTVEFGAYAAEAAVSMSDELADLLGTAA